MPFIFTKMYIHIEVEYFEKDVVRECADGHPLIELICVAKISNRYKRGLRLGTSTCLDLLGPMIPVVDAQHVSLPLSA